MTARVLILAQDDFLTGDLGAGLDHLGWTTLVARGPVAALSAIKTQSLEAVILDLSSAEMDPGLARRIKAAALPRLLPVLVVGAELIAEDHGWDLRLTAPFNPLQISLRIEHLVRSSVAEEEFDLRKLTFLERGVELNDPAFDETPIKVLVVGEPNPEFLPVHNLLTRRGVEVVAAFSSYSAFDFLHEAAFDAVLLFGGKHPQEALSIASGMRRNSRLYHLPCLLWLNAERGPERAEIHQKGVTDLLMKGADPDEAVMRLLVLARAHKKQTAVRQALEQAKSSVLMDARTGLFTRDLFAAHLVRLADAARERHRPMCFCVIKIMDQPEAIRARDKGWLDNALPQIGGMISRLVRSEDTAARLGPEIFALALPATEIQAARQVADRIAAVIGCTAFESEIGEKPFVLEFDLGVSQLHPDEPPGAALERAAQEAMGLHRVAI